MGDPCPTHSDEGIVNDGHHPRVLVPLRVPRRHRPLEPLPHVRMLLGLLSLFARPLEPAARDGVVLLMMVDQEAVRAQHEREVTLRAEHEERNEQPDAQVRAAAKGDGDGLRGESEGDMEEKKGVHRSEPDAFGEKAEEEDGEIDGIQAEEDGAADTLAVKSHLVAEGREMVSEVS